MEPTKASPDFPELRPRALARYFAATAIYQIQVTRDSVATVLGTLWNSEEGRSADIRIRTFTTQLVEIVFGNLGRIDELIRRYAPQRALNRVPEVDLALLRVGCAELLYLSDIPVSVTINEMVDLAKLLCADESPPFVNAVLDRVKEHRNDIPESEKASSQWSNRTRVSA
jgi:N utilization substance protein B